MITRTRHLLPLVVVSMALLLSEARSEEIFLRRKGQGTIMEVTAVTSKVKNARKVKRTNTFGLYSMTSDSPQSVLNSLEFRLGDSASVVVPPELTSTLYNTIVTRDMSVMHDHRDDSLIVSFSGGDGERAYYAKFTYNKDEATIKRVVREIAYGRDTEELWKQTEGKWIRLEYKKPKMPK